MTEENPKNNVFYEFNLPHDVLADLMQRALAGGHLFRMKAYGYSMSPFIKPGDQVTISPLGKKPVIGQVIAVIQPATGAVLLHRVIAVQKDGCITQGDNRGDETDGFVPIENIIGYISTVERNNMKVFFGQGFLGMVIAVMSKCGLLQKLVRIAHRMMTLIHELLNK